MEERYLQVFLDTTARCNLRCRMCLVAYQEERYARKPPEISNRLRNLPQVMSHDLFLRIAQDIFPRTKTLYLSCGFEPLMNKDFDWFLQQTAPYKIPHIGFTTNGVLLTEEINRQCIKTPVHEISVSLDGARAETFESIRPGATWDRVFGNLRRLLEMRDSAGSNLPRIRLNYVLMRRNIEEVVDFVDLAADLGVDLLDFRHVVVFDVAKEMRNESLADHRDLANRWLRAAQERAVQRGLQIAYLPLFSKPRLIGRLRSWWRGRQDLRSGGPRCTAPWDTLVITPLGFVGPCAGWLRDAPLGNLTRQTLDEIFESEGMKRVRDGLLGRGPLADSCVVCPTVSGRSTDKMAFTEIEMDCLDRIWLEVYNREFEWGLDLDKSS